MSFLSVPITLQSLFGQDRKIGDIEVNVVINENTSDVLTITKQPVQQGASITDHAFKEPVGFSMSILFRDNLTTSLSKLYQQLVDLQNSRVPFAVTTPKRIYRDMLISTINQTTDKTTENCLAINITFQEVILVNIATVSVPKSSQRNPQRTAATQPAGKKQSALSTLFGG